MLRLSSVAALLAVAASAQTPHFELTAESKAAALKAPLCDTCVQLGEQGLNELINAILNVGVAGGCGKLCSYLSSPNEQKVCDVVCEIVGIQEFIKAVQKADLDPIYLCELVRVCEAGPDDAHVDLLSVALNPPTISESDIEPGKDGVDLQGVLTVNVTKASGVGEFRVSVHGPVEGAQGPIGGSFILADGLKEGVQNLGVKLTIKDSPPGPPPAPGQPPPQEVRWMPGSYEFEFHVCQGECDSKHPHSVDFGTKGGNFTISASQLVV